MKIIHSLEGKAWSGGQQQALFLAEQQHKMGHEVLLMCQKGSVLEEKALAAGLNVAANDYRKEIHPVSIFNLLQHYDRFKPDVVNVHRAWAHTQWILVALLRRFKGLIVTRRVLFKPDFNPVSLAKYRTPAVRGYIAVSDAVAERLVQTGVKKSRIKVVYSATDTDRFNPDLDHELSGNWPLKKDQPAVLLVGNFNRNKGHQVLISAFNSISKEWPELNLILAGHNTDCDELKKLAQSGPASERIHLLGFRNDIPALMARSSITVNASFQEGFSGTIRESLSMGVPVIASNIPANVEMSRKVPITLFECGNSQDLARKILEFKTSFDNKEIKESLRRKTIEAFSVEKMVNNTLKAYRELL
ncbi:MAG: glycosyltransferase family 4 protein [Candidatus Rifleibacteriota bacterium]